MKCSPSWLMQWLMQGFYWEEKRTEMNCEMEQVKLLFICHLESERVFVLFKLHILSLFWYVGPWHAFNLNARICASTYRLDISQSRFNLHGEIKTWKLKVAYFWLNIDRKVRLVVRPRGEQPLFGVCSFIWWSLLKLAVMSGLCTAAPFSCPHWRLKWLWLKALSLSIIWYGFFFSSVFLLVWWLWPSSACQTYKHNALSYTAGEKLRIKFQR